MKPWHGVIPPPHGQGYYPYEYDRPPQLAGWKCPRCLKVNAPHSSTCMCAECPTCGEVDDLGPPVNCGCEGEE